MNNEYVKVEQIKPAEIQKHQEEECILSGEFDDLFDDDFFKDMREKMDEKYRKMDEKYRKMAEEREAALKKIEKLSWYASQLVEHMAKHQPK
jgi:hypothetical protein